MTPRLPLLLLPACLLPLACASPTAASHAAPERAPQDEDLELAVARLNARLAELEGRQSVQEAFAAVEAAESELEMARAAFEHFEEVQSAHRRAEAELDLRRAEDQVREAEEERAQLEQMYGAEELADATAEIVLRRTARRLERARMELGLHQQTVTVLVEFDLPKERMELEAALRSAEAGLQSAQIALDVAQMQAELAGLEARKELAEHATGEDGPHEAHEDGHE